MVNSDSFEESTTKAESTFFQEEISCEYESQVLIQEQEKNGTPNMPPLYCVPGAGAGVTVFLPFANAIGPCISIYGLQPQGLDGQHTPHNTVSAAATAHIKNIQKCNPRGPYRLIGHSFGGWIVLEMAKQMLATGMQVDFVVVIDSRPPLEIKQRFVSEPEAVYRLIKILRQIENRLPLISIKELTAKSKQELLHFLHSLMKEYDLISKRSNVSVIKDMMNLFWININTSYSYMYSLPIPLIVAVASETIAETYDPQLDPDEGVYDLQKWSDFSSELTLLTLEGNHSSILKDGNVNTLVQEVLKRI
jgi:thioesterase domain-containing protein